MKFFFFHLMPWPYLADDFGELVNTTGAERNRESVRGELDGGGFADARRCAGDDRRPAFGEGFKPRHIMGPSAELESHG